MNQLQRLENQTHRKALQPDFQDDGDDRQFPNPVTPYQRGFDHGTYSLTYLNVFNVGGAEWLAYDAGFADATNLRLLRRRALP